MSTTELTDHCENLSSQHANAPEQPTEGSGPSTPSTVPSGTNTESTIPSPEQSDTETTPAPINHKARRSSSSSSDSETDNSPNTYNPLIPAPITEEPKMADTLYKNYADIDNTVTYKEGRDAAELKRHLMYLKAEKDSKTKLLRTTRGLAEVTTNAITKQDLQQDVDDITTQIAAIETEIPTVEKRLKRITDTVAKTKLSLTIPEDTGNTDGYSLRDLQLACPTIKKSNGKPDFKRMYNKLIQHGTAHNFSHSTYKSALSMILTGTMLDYYETIQDLTFPEIVKDLQNRFISTIEMETYLTEMENFTRKGNEDLRDAITRYEVLLRETACLYPPKDQPLRQELQRERILKAICSPTAHKEITRIKDEATRAARTVPFEYLLDMAERTEVRNRDAPTEDITIETTCNAMIMKAQREGRHRSSSRNRSGSYDKTRDVSKPHFGKGVDHRNDPPLMKHSQRTASMSPHKAAKAAEMANPTLSYSTVTPINIHRQDPAITQLTEAASKMGITVTEYIQKLQNGQLTQSTDRRSRKDNYEEARDRSQSREPKMRYRSPGGSNYDLYTKNPVQREKYISNGTYFTHTGQEVQIRILDRSTSRGRSRSKSLPPCPQCKSRAPHNIHKCNGTPPPPKLYDPCAKCQSTLPHDIWNCKGTPPEKRSHSPYPHGDLN